MPDVATFRIRPRAAIASGQPALNDKKQDASDQQGHAHRKKFLRQLEPFFLQRITAGPCDKKRHHYFEKVVAHRRVRPFVNELMKALVKQGNHG